MLTPVCHLPTTIQYVLYLYVVFSGDIHALYKCTSIPYVLYSGVLVINTLKPKVYSSIVLILRWQFGSRFSSLGPNSVGYRWIALQQVLTEYYYVLVV